MPKKSLDQLSPSYRRRIERALAKGSTLSQARGHAKQGEKSISQIKAETLSSRLPQENPLEKAIRDLKRGSSLKEASKNNGVSQQKLKKYISSQPDIQTGRGKVLKTTAKGERYVNQYTIQADNRPIEWFTYSGGRAIPVLLNDPVQKSLNGRYLNDVQRALKGDLSALRKWKGVSLVDAQGNKIPLDTDIKSVRKASRGTHPNPYRIAV